MNAISSKSNIFLEKSYQDAWSDYQYSLKSARAAVWDWVFITASNEKQASIYRLQIEERLNDNYLPSKTKYVVISDPGGKRVGSGGATLNVLKYIGEHSDNSNKNIFEAKILVIHSGGDSKRIPQYSVCGKLFSPVPRLSPDGRRLVLFDEIMVSLAAIPNRMNYGMLVMSGDALLIFNPLQVDLKLNKSAVAISIKESVETGVNHGVFLANEKKQVVNFLHKQTAETLSNIGAVDDNGCIDLDTGAIWFNKDIVKDLFSLISKNGFVDSPKFDAMVNENVRLSFYGDFLYPVAENAVYSEYMESDGEVAVNDQLLNCRQLIWNILNKYDLFLIRMSPAKFIHFGTSHELHELVTKSITQYEYLGWNKNILTNAISDKSSINNSYIAPETVIGKACYIEDCYIGKNAKIGDNVILSNLKVSNAEIPSGIVLNCIELNGNKFCVRIYGINDNPKNSIDGSFLNGTLDGFAKNTNICLNDLWSANIYPICDTIESAVEYALIIYRISDATFSAKDLQKWKDSPKTSLEGSFREADASKILKWKNHLESIIRAENFISALSAKKDAKSAINTLNVDRRIADKIDLLLEKAGNYEFSTQIRIYQALSYLAQNNSIDSENASYHYFENKCYELLNREINNNLIDKLPTEEIVGFAKDKVAVELPARVNWGGGWSDTPPYCIENGGTVLNAAVKLNGKRPIKVVAKKIPDRMIKFKSDDLGYEKIYSNKEEILNLCDANDPFPIHKGSLIVMGIITDNGSPLLEDVLDKIGGGICISSCVDIPKGSGLGTSTILAATCLKSLYEIFGIEYDNNLLYLQVLRLEQLIGGGGGWQDQVGGITDGIKMIKSQPGVIQNIVVEYIDVPTKALEELRERFVLVYSGQQRLAKNILREVMNKYVLSDEQTIDILYEIQRLAVLMKFELEKGNISAFAKLLDTHWELSKKLDAGSSNTCIDQIFDMCDDLIDGKFICGAGGGGFLQMILKKGVTKDALRERLGQLFKNSGVEVWDCELT